MAKIDNFQIRLRAIEERLTFLSEEHDIDCSEVFLSFAASTIFDTEVTEIDPVDIIDGNQDKQIDYIRIESNEDSGEADIYIIQAKKESGFSSNTAIQMRNGLDWIFESKKDDYIKLKNHALIEKIKEIRDLRIEYGASNLNVSVFYATLADSSNLPEEYRQERGTLIEKYESAGFGSFQYREIGVHELFSLLNQSEKAKHKIDLDLNIVYDVNRPSVIEFSSGEVKAILCTITGKELAQIAKTEPRDAIFDLNVRPFYGLRGRVNQEIWNTSTSENEADKFWFLNNGITITCDSYDFSRDPDRPIIKLKNAQIVNGCQTSVTIRSAEELKNLSENVKVLARIYASDNNDFIERITLTTNNQNKITDRDLKANDNVQRDIEKLMLEYDFYYERKNKQHKNLRGEKKKRIIPNDKCAQAYLAIVRGKPSNARGYLGAIWSNFYDEIFKNATVEDLLACYLIYKHCQQMAKTAQKSEEIERDRKDTQVYGMFHIARCMGFKLLENKWGANNRAKITRLIRTPQDVAHEMQDAYDWALDVVDSLRKRDEKAHKPALYFKSQSLQKQLNQSLIEQLSKF